MTPESTPAVTDGTLIEATSSGDESAFEHLFERHYARVYGVALRIVGSPEDAEEIAQDVFVRLYRHQGARSGDGSLGGWLYRVALNASFNFVRSRNRRFGRLRRFALLERSEPSVQASPVAELERNEEIERVRRGLARLSEKQRNALVLRSHGLQYAEIAAVLDIPPSSVGQTLARGERALRRELENEEVDQ